MYVIASTAIPVRLWLRIWTHPRATIREILDHHQQSLWWLPLAFASGIAQTLVRGHNNNVGLRVPVLMMLLVALPIGMIWGVVQLYVITGVFYLMGNWSGGKATFSQLRTVLAWSSAPQIAILLVWLTATLFFGRFLYVSPRLLPQYGLALALAVVFVFLCTVVGAVWGLVILVTGVSEAQQVSAPEAFFQLLGSMLVLGVAALVILVPLMLLLVRR